jgi:PEP-CTERM motif
MASVLIVGWRVARVLGVLGGALLASVAHAQGYTCTQAFVGQQYQGSDNGDSGGVCLTSGALSLYLVAPVGGRLSFQVEQVEDGRIKLVAGRAYDQYFSGQGTAMPVYGLGAAAVAYVEPGAGVAAGTMSFTGTVTRDGRSYLSLDGKSEVFLSTEVTEPLAYQQKVLQVDVRPDQTQYQFGVNLFAAGVIPMVSAGFYQQKGSLRLALNPMVIDVSVAAVPEPSTWALMGLGLLGMGIVQRHRQTSQPTRWA